jgi:hypothetical protein
MKITFDMTALKSSSLSNENVYITFAAANCEMVYGSGASAVNINFINNFITINDSTYSTSNAYRLCDIATNGLVLNSATSLIGFISYGSANNIMNLKQGQPAFLNSSTPRYSVFEISYDGTTGGADITNISQFGASITLAFLNHGTIQSQVGNSINTTSMFNSLAAASGFSGTTSTAAILIDVNGKFLRAIGTNVFPIGQTQTPYSKFNAYLQSLFKTNTNNSFLNLTNLATGASPGGQGAVGTISTSKATKVTPKTSYNLDYHFTAVITQATTSDSTNDNPNGTYSIVLSGYVNATPTGEGSADAEKYKYQNLSITIAADDLKSGSENLYMTNFIYQASTTGAGINVTANGWDDELNNDFGTGFVNGALLQKVAADFAQGMTCGFPGSTTPAASTPASELGSLSSYDWWRNSQLAYAKAQTINPYYSVWGNAVYANSNGSVYGSPYDDRFKLNLISPDANTTEMRITLLEDGDLKP